MKIFKKYAFEIKKLFCLAAAWIVSLALQCNFEIADFDSGSGFMTEFFYRFGRSFTFMGWVDIVVLLFSFFAIRYIALKDERIDVGAAILAGLFSLLYVFTESYARYYTSRYICGGGGIRHLFL